MTAEDVPPPSLLELALRVLRGELTEAQAIEIVRGRGKDETSDA